MFSTEKGRVMESRVDVSYEFGPFRLDTAGCVLRRGEETVHLTPKEFDLLSALVRGGGRVMTKDELMKEVWPDTFVEEKTLAQNIFTLRKSLAKEDKDRQYIETVPRRGYRFAAPVRELRGDETHPSREAVRADASPEATSNDWSASSDAETGRTRNERATEFYETSRARRAEGGGASVGPASHHEARPGHPVRAAVIISIAVVLIFGALVYAVYKLSVKPQTAPRAPAFQSMKVTRLPVSGDVIEAAISPDGNYLAYIAPETDGRGTSLWVRQVSAASHARRIVEASEAASHGGLMFSPDSQHVYYNARPSVFETLSTFRVPVLGGESKKILDNVNGRVSFSPDGKRITFTRGEPPKENMSILIADTDGRNERRLVTSEYPNLLGLPVWSPKGDVIAYGHADGTQVESGNQHIGVKTVNIADGATSSLTGHIWVGVQQLAWLPDGDGLVVNATERELSPAQLWQLSYPSGELRRVTNDLNSYAGASVTADASAMVTVQTDRIPNVWVAPDGDAARARQITSGAGKFDGYYGVSWTPDGRIVYASIASGSWDIWVMNADGTEQKQLTSEARSNYGPSVSPDGRHIVFVSNRAGTFNVWRMNTDGSNPVRLTSGAGENFPHVTPDGRWVVYSTYGLSQRHIIWKVPIDGGEPVRLTDRESSWPFVSPDGDAFVCIYDYEPNAQPKLAVIPIEGGAPRKLFDTEASFRANVVWMPDGRGIAYLDARTGTNNVWMQPLSGGPPVQLTDFKGDGVIAFDWSRDGEQLVATRSVDTTGVVLIRDFVNR